MTLSEKLQQGKTDTEAALLASDLETWRLERLALLNQLLGVGGQRASAFSTASAQTAATGTNWVALPSGACTAITARNRSGVSVHIRPINEAVSLTLADGDDLPLPCLANSNEWEIRRVDTSNTQVAIQFLRVTQ